jgi:hypothetical protein
MPLKKGKRQTNKPKVPEHIKGNTLIESVNKIEKEWQKRDEYTLLRRFLQDSLKKGIQMPK